MRVCVGCTLLVLSALGVSFAQDTNFATGPQYLLSQGSPFFARSISTPSLSLSGPALEVGASNATEGLSAGAENRGASLFQPDALPKVDFFSIYYGAPRVSVIEISFPESSGGSSSLIGIPPSIVEAGVWEMTTAQALHDRGYGVTLVEAAAYEKAHTGHATHIYTNADIDRLHSTS